MSKNTTFSLASERRRQILTLGLMALSYAPFLLLSTLPEATSSSMLFYIARQFGYAAVILLLWQHILGSRTISNLWLRDQLWALSIHKKLGIAGIALVVGHPLLIAWDYADFSLIYTPDFSTEFGKHVAFGRVALFLFVFIWITSALLRSKIGFRPWKYIHYLTYPVLASVLLHAPEIGTFYAQSDVIPILWNAITVLFISIVILRGLHFISYGQTRFILTNKKEIADDVFLYTLKPKNKPLKSNVHPGQFVYVRRGLMSEEHPFTVAGYSKDGSIQVASKVFGKYTKKLSQLQPKDEVLIDGPYGVFTHEVAVQSDTPVTFIAGGIGITPFLPHIMHKTNKNITLFYANRNRSNIVRADVLQKLLGKKYIDVLSDDPKAKAEHGYITAELLQKKLGKAFNKQDFYICGPPGMMAALKDSLTQAGISATQIHTEEFGY